MRLPDTGDTIVDRYQLGPALGEGGFAMVYRAIDLRQDRAVAVKVIKPEGPEYSPSRVARFERELGALVRLSNPHTVRVLDHGRTLDGVMFLVFELVPGNDLSAYSNQGPMPPDIVRHILMQVLGSLQEAHLANVLHRDIKPANIRVFQNGDDRYFVKLLDFGVARPLMSQAPGVTKTGHMVGTLKYASPEQLFGWDLTPSSDLYSLGIVAYLLLTGELPDHMREYAAKRPIRLPEGVADDGLRYAVERMLAHEPSNRFASAALAMQALMNGPPSGVTRARAEEPVATVRAMGLYAAVAAAALVGGALAAVLLLKTDDEEASPTMVVAPVNRTALIDSPATTLGPKVARVVTADPPPAVNPDDAVEVPEELVLPEKMPRGCGREAPFTGRQDWTDMDGHSYHLVIPDGYDKHKQHAALIMFHEVGEMPLNFVRYSGFVPHAQEHNYVIIAPAGQYLDPWKGSMAKHVVTIESALNELCIDRDRIFAVGNGSGGIAVEKLPCEFPVRAIAHSGFRNTDLGETRCLKKEGIPAMFFAHSKDGYDLIEGGKGCYGDPRLSLAEKEQIWRGYNECSGKSEVYYKFKGTKCSTWTCEAPLVSCVVDGGRRWPHTQPRMWDVRNCDGPIPDFEYVPVIWDFFKEQVADGDLSPRPIGVPAKKLPLESPPE